MVFSVIRVDKNWLKITRRGFQKKEKGVKDSLRSPIDPFFIYLLFPSVLPASVWWTNTPIPPLPHQEPQRFMQTQQVPDQVNAGVDRVP